MTFKVTFSTLDKLCPHCAAGNEINPMAKSLAGQSLSQEQTSLELPTQHTDPKQLPGKPYSNVFMIY